MDFIMFTQNKMQSKLAIADGDFIYFVALNFAKYTCILSLSNRKKAIIKRIYSSEKQTQNDSKTSTDDG